MKEFIKKIREMPWGLKILLCCVFPPAIMVVVFSHLFGSVIEMEEKMNAVSLNPTEETVRACIVFFEKAWLGFNNHPDNWNRIRKVWYVVNGSSKVTTETKKKFLEKLINRGLHLNETRVINNYDGR